MTKLVNRAKMTTATTGTGTITLGSAVDGYQTFAAAGVADADVVRYVIEDGDAWEIGLGTYTASGTTLTRASIESSNSDLALNLTGNAVVFVSAAAADLQELVDFADNFVLPTSDGSTGQVLQTNGAGTLSFTTISGYTDADVDTHLNTGTASSGEVLSWTGSDYDWIAVSAGATDIDGLSDGRTSGDDSSIGLGTGALETIVSAVACNALGFQAIQNTTTGDFNNAVGYRALQQNQTNNGNDAFGFQSGRYVRGNYNTAMGYEALLGDVSVYLTGSYNVGIGYQTGYDLTTGNNNSLIGSRAGTDLTTGSNNVAIGNGALDAATTGGRNIAIGQDAMGLGAATAANGNNIAIGYQAGYDLTTGTNNVAIGPFSGENQTTSTINVLIGPSAGSSLTTGSQNVAVGNQALQSGSTTGFNVAVGRHALQNGSGQGYSTGVGYYALANSAAAFNTALGYQAGLNHSSGESNVFIGSQAGDASTSGSNKIIIGAGADGSSATVSNEITLGNSSITTLRCQVTTITSLSDARDKTDIQPLNAGLEFVEALNPVSFNWAMRDGGKVGEADTGFIAQDLQAAQADTGVSIPGLVYDVNPDKLEAGYGKLIPVLVQAIKDLSAKVNLLEAQLEAQK